MRGENSRKSPADSATTPASELADMGHHAPAHRLVRQGARCCTHVFADIVDPRGRPASVSPALAAAVVEAIARLDDIVKACLSGMRAGKRSSRAGANLGV